MAERKETREQEAEQVAEELLEKEIEKEIQEISQTERDKIARDRERKDRESRRDGVDVESWGAKTQLGKEVKSKKVKNIDEILDKKRKILESEIVDSLINVRSDLISIGQSKGKFGGGKRRAWKQTQRKTAESNASTFSCMVIVGDEKVLNRTLRTLRTFI